MFVARKSCPVFATRTRVLHVGFDDPPLLAANTETDEMAMAHYGRVRDETRFFLWRVSLKCSWGNRMVIRWSPRDAASRERRRYGS